VQWIELLSNNIRCRHVLLNGKPTVSQGMMLAIHLRAGGAPSFVPIVKAHERSLVDPGTLAGRFRAWSGSTNRFDSAEWLPECDVGICQRQHGTLGLPTGSIDTGFKAEMMRV
jgi:hypothetical protein